VHDRVEPPDPDMLVGVTLHDVLLVTRPTAPEKPFSPVTVIVEVGDVPALAVTVVGLAEIAKSWNLKIAAMEWVREVLVPAIVAV